MRLAGKVTLVTGAQQGIGEAIGLAFGRKEANGCMNALDDLGNKLEPLIRFVHYHPIQNALDVFKCWVLK